MNLTRTRRLSSLRVEFLLATLVTTGIHEYSLANAVSPATTPARITDVETTSGPRSASATALTPRQATADWTGFLPASLPAAMRPSALPRQVPDPPSNPRTFEKIRLGRDLFFDPILSTTRDVACATCHHPRYGWADGRSTPLGIGGRGLGPARKWAGPSAQPRLPRNTPGLLNVGFNGWVSGTNLPAQLAPMFWDGRVQGLEAQFPLPVGTPGEMCGGPCLGTDALNEAVARVRQISEYVERFRRAFEDVGTDPVSGLRLAQAVAAFERTLVTGPAPIDRFLAGDSQALTADQQAGYRIFLESGCAHCHGGPMFSDFQLHFIGVPDRGPDEDRPLRTPSLRQLRYTAPYLHDGRLPSVRAVLRFYDELVEAVSETQDGGAALPGPPLDPLLRHLQLDPAEFPLLEAFLDSLNSEDFDRTVPTNVPSGLRIE